MVWRLGLLTLFTLLSAIPAQAGIIFNRHSRKPSKENTVTDPTAQLIQVARTDSDDRRRAAAVEELGQFDLRQYPQAAFALIQVLQGDSSAAVRGEAAKLLGKMRPLTQQVAEALDVASSTDSAPGVRQLARASLLPFLSAGYKQGNRSDAPANEPSYAGPAAQPARPIAPSRLPSPFVRQNPRPATLGNETTEPPLADAAPTESAKPAYPSAPSNASPARPTIPSVKPPLATESKPSTNKPKPIELTPRNAEKPAPAKPSEGEGPILIPPQ